MKKRKLFFPNGVLSLVFLPIICLLFIKQNDHFIHERILPVFFLNNKKPSLFNENFNNFIANKKYEHFYLTNQETNNKEAFNSATKSIQKLVNSQDTINGIHFHISDNAKFKTFIDIINLCKLLKVKVYIPIDNGVLLLNPIPQKLQKPQPLKGFVCGSSNYIDYDFKYVKSEDEIKKERAEKLTFITETAKTHILSILIFIVMIFINIKKNRVLLLSDKRRRQ
jgi:hypothetical protein